MRTYSWPRSQVQTWSSAAPRPSSTRTVIALCCITRWAPSLRGHMHIVQVELDTGRVQVLDARIPHGRQDATQVRVAGVERCLDQRRMGNRIGHLAAFGAGLAAL